MLKLKLQYFGHLMWKADSLENTFMLGKSEGKMRRGQQRMRWLGSITDLVNLNLSNFWEIVKDRGAWLAVVCGVTKSQTWLSDRTTTVTSCRNCICGNHCESLVLNYTWTEPECLECAECLPERKLGQSQPACPIFSCPLCLSESYSPSFLKPLPEFPSYGGFLTLTKLLGLLLEFLITCKQLLPHFLIDPSCQ